MNTLNFLYCSVLIVALLTSCEQPFDPPTNDDPDELIVEGYIEAGADAQFPYIILTKSSPYFSEIDLVGSDELFVHDAQVTVTDHHGTVYPMTEVCWATLTEDQRNQLGPILGLDPSDAETDYCIYLDITFQLEGEINGTYTLDILTQDGLAANATTTIPPHIPIDSLFWKGFDDERLEDYREMYVYFQDLPDRSDYYRYFVGVNEMPIRSAFVTDDDFFDGLYFKAFLFRPTESGEDFDPLYDGLYQVGDTVNFKWANIDQAQFDFWSTVDANQSQGPFSSYIRLSSNIEGGLGIWGGQSISNYQWEVK